MSIRYFFVYLHNHSRWMGT